MYEHARGKVYDVAQEGVHREEAVRAARLWGNRGSFRFGVLRGTRIPERWIVVDLTVAVSPSCLHYHVYQTCT